MAIANGSRWTLFKYFENNYYQLFHAEPVLTYILSLIMGTSLNNIPFVLFTVRILPIFCLYIKHLSHNLWLVRDRRVAQLALLLFSITPPLTLTRMVTQSISIVLTLSTLLMMFCYSKDIRNILIAILVLTIASVIFHAIYPLMIISFLSPVLLIEELKCCSLRPW